tara:strand:- start:353 stop:808 length:456 start_codon:yes stop_codon:yes gene_type:complete
MDLAKETVYWMFRIVIIGIAVVFIIWIVGSTVNYGLETHEVKSYVLRNKIILDENCLAYAEYRAELTVIDINKFNKNNLVACLNTDNGVLLNLTYEGFSEEIRVNNDLADKIHFCYDEETFSCIEKEYNLIINKDLQEIPGKLKIITIDLR